MKCRLTTSCLTVLMILYMSLLYYMLAVGCEHTCYKSLMAGLATEWIHDAFAVRIFFKDFSTVLRQTL